MGFIRIDLGGSFGVYSRQFDAQTHGHADAVAQAIEYLSATVLPMATAKDHKLAAEGAKPLKGFDRGG